MKLLSFRVHQRIEETSKCCSFLLEPLDDQNIVYRPGQYLSMQIPLASGPIFRSYSFSSSPKTEEQPRITIKREPNGRGSNWLCDNLKEGDVIKSLYPAGDFVPADLSVPLLLIAGGSGITPIISIMKSALLSGSRFVRLVYANRSEDQVILREELRDWQSQYPDTFSVVTWLDDEQGTPTPEKLLDALGSEIFGEVYICGPSVFMESAVQAVKLRGYSEDTIFLESFTVEHQAEATIDEADGQTESGTDSETNEIVNIHVEQGGQTYCVTGQSDQYLLDAMIAHGLNVPSSCRSGNCGTCLCTLEEGSAILSENTVLDDDDVEEGWILACRARPKSAKIKVVFP